MNIAFDALAELARHDDHISVEELANDLGHDETTVRYAIRRAFLADAAPLRPIEMIVELDGPPGWVERDGGWTKLRLGRGLPFPVRPMTLTETHLLLLAAQFVLTNDDARDAFGEHAESLEAATTELMRLVAPDAPSTAVRADLRRTAAIAELQELVGSGAAFRYRKRFIDGHFDDETPFEWTQRQVWTDAVRFDHGRWYVETRELDSGKRKTFRGEFIDDVRPLADAPEPPPADLDDESGFAGVLVRLHAQPQDEDELLRAEGAIVSRRGGRLTVELRFYPPVEERLTHLLLGLDPRTVVVEPEELRHLPRDAVQEILEQYAGG